MNPYELIVGREYIIKGTSIEHPVGFGTIPKKINYTNRGVFIKIDGDKLRFDKFTLHYNGSNPSKPQLRLNSCTTIDIIVEANK